jgi:hypothetical protein
VDWRAGLMGGIALDMGTPQRGTRGRTSARAHHYAQPNPRPLGPFAAIRRLVLHSDERS